MKKLKTVWILLLAGLLALGILTGCSGGQSTPANGQQQEQQNGGQQEGNAGNESETAQISEDGSYTSKEDVALYLHTYGKLPSNFITKSEAKELGWSGGSLEPYAPGMCIGGDRFGNYENNLPDGRDYYECDIDTLGASERGAKRIVYSSDGLIYYTEDHYNSFTLLYGEE